LNISQSLAVVAAVEETLVVAVVQVVLDQTSQDLCRLQLLFLQLDLVLQIN
tara:strand:+ start:667 stop:819 length:153 start_codon:yes stop_codon:yes gene_type:complete